jgi:hypothetical protein
VFVAWHLQDKYEENKKGYAAPLASTSLAKEDSSEQKSEEQIASLGGAGEVQSESSSSFIETAIKSEDKKATIYHRYYHVFKEGELESLIEDNFAGRFVIRDRYYDHANWAVICEKIAE